MDHELKQRLIGAVVVTALCAIFIPMLFDDPVDNSGQLVSELNIPAPVAPGAAAKLPSSAEQVLKSTDPEPLSTEPAGDTLESTAVAEEATEEPEKGRSGESLYAESEGYANAEEAVDQPAEEPEDNLSKPRSKQAPAEAVDGVHKTIAPKTQIKDTGVESIAKEPVRVKKVIETAKPALAKDNESVAIVKEPARPIVKKPEYEAPITTKDEAQATLKQPSSAKSLAAAVAEAKKPEAVAPKTPPKLVRWYIQLGSFSKKENAMSLWDSLREQGVPASLDTVQTDKGVSYRLRVGPELDGKKAAAMKSRLDRQNIKAMLISE